MSFTRSMYDKCSALKHDTESNGPYSLISDVSVRKPKGACFLKTSPFMRVPTNSIPSDIVQLESELRNQTRPLGHCDKNKYTPKPKCTDCTKCDSSCDCLHCLTSKKYTNEIECKNDATGLNPEYTRFNKSYKDDLFINRSENLHMNVQKSSRIGNSKMFGVNTRLSVRDSYDSRKV
jgi:hypothetical protein